MTHWIVREWMNAITLALFLCLAWRFWRVRVEAPHDAPRRDAATALLVLSVGESVRSAWAWLALASQNKGWGVFETVQDAWAAGFVAAALILVGVVCCLRVFSSTRSHRGGVIAMGLAATFLAFTILI